MNTLQKSTRVLALSSLVASSALAQFTPTSRDALFHVYTGYVDYARTYTLADGNLNVSRTINSPGLDCRPPASSNASLASVIAPGYLSVHGDGVASAAELPPCGYGGAAGNQTVDWIYFTVTQEIQVRLNYEFHTTTSNPNENPPHADCFVNADLPTIMTTSGLTSNVEFHVDGQADAAGSQCLTLLPGSYSLEANGFTGLTSSQSGQVTIHSHFFQVELVANMIATQPSSVSVCPFGIATFSITPVGSGPFTYRWQWQPAPGAAFVDVTSGLNTDPQGGPIRFVSENPQTAAVTLSDYGGSGTAMSHWDLRCIVTNACGSVTSNAATLTVCPADFNCDSGVDFFDYLDFVDAFSSQSSGADFNHDDTIDFFDYLDFVDAFSMGC